MSSASLNYRHIGDSSTGTRKIFQRRAALSLSNVAPIPAKTLYLSTDGLSVMIDRPIEEGQRCTISISLVLDEKPRQLVAQCRVQNCILVGMTGYRIEILFQNVDAATAEMIKKLMGST